ncbi:MAG: DUF1036 domain-containing protein [Alphaproteobacteria bacterium]
MGSLRCALLCLCLMAGGLAAAQADQLGLDTCLGALDDMEIEMMILGRDNDSCSARRSEIDDAEALAADMNKILEGECRADRISGGSYDAAQIAALRKLLTADVASLRTEIKTMRAEATKACGGTASPPDKSPSPPAGGSRKSGDVGKPTSFVLTVCNNDGSRVDLAVSHRSEQGSDDFWVEGWWWIDPGQCVQVGRFVNGWFYFYAAAEDDDGVWSGDLPICVSHEPFKRMSYAHANVTCDEDELMHFNEVLIEGSEYTINLNP